MGNVGYIFEMRGAGCHVCRSSAENSFDAAVFYAGLRDVAGGFLGAPAFAAFRAFELFGRTAFPIFAFSVAQGSRHTHSRERYLLRLPLVGLISESRFSSPSNGARSGWHDECIFYAAARLLRVYVVRALRAKMSGRVASIQPCALMAVYIAEYMHMDYGGYGVFCIFLLYAVRNRLCSAPTTVLTALLYGAPFSADAALLFIADGRLCAAPCITRARPADEMAVLRVLSGAFDCAVRRGVPARHRLISGLSLLGKARFLHKKPDDICTIISEKVKNNC
ncbi:MAG: TraX family protein [Butyricicoccus sp.]